MIINFIDHLFSYRAKESIAALNSINETMIEATAAIIAAITMAISILASINLLM